MPEIVFSEKELEDFLCEGKNLEKHLGLRFIARQVFTPNGIVDILAYNKVSKKFVIVELKKDELDRSAFFQVERYHHYFKNMRSRSEYYNFSSPLHKDRIFDRLIIGKTLNQELNYMVNLWEPYCGCNDSVNYALFAYEFDKGIVFSYMNEQQQDIENGEIYG